VEIFFCGLLLKKKHLVDWGYMDSVMKSPNLPFRWRKCIWESVSSASACVLVNASRNQNAAAQYTIYKETVKSNYCLYTCVSMLSLTSMFLAQPKPDSKRVDTMDVISSKGNKELGETRDTLRMIS
jgi:hypothetical protein